MCERMVGGRRERERMMGRGRGNEKEKVGEKEEGGRREEGEYWNRRGKFSLLRNIKEKDGEKKGVHRLYVPMC